MMPDHEGRTVPPQKAPTDRRSRVLSLLGLLLALVGTGLIVLSAAGCLDEVDRGSTLVLCSAIFTLASRRPR